MLMFKKKMGKHLHNIGTVPIFVLSKADETPQHIHHIVPRGTYYTTLFDMNTTTDTATAFTPNAVYSVPSLGIQYQIEFNHDRTRARICDNGFVSEWVVISGLVRTDGTQDQCIDPFGYMIPVSACQDLPTFNGLKNSLFYFRHKDADTPGFSGYTGSVHNVPGWRAAVERLKFIHPDNYRDFVPVGVTSRFPIVVEDTVYKLHNGTYYPVDMPDEVVEICARNMGHDGMRFVFDFGDLETGRSWNESFDTTGYIGRSTGTVKIPLLIHSRRSHGGPALIGSIVRVLAAKGKRVLYQHPKYHSLIWPKWHVTVRHDKGKSTIVTAAPDENSARESICAAEGCPPSAIVSVRRLS